VPQPGIRAPARSTFRDTVVYDVVYSIDGNSLRKAPPVTADRPTGCVVFFGCSFVFGEGLNDDETLPYRLGVLTGGAYRIYNFGFHGYGPQQMLSALENGYLERRTACAPTHVIYEAIPDHVARAAGLHGFMRLSPRYVLAPDGSVIRKGSYDGPTTPTTPFEVTLDYHLRKSYLFRWFSSRPRRVTDADVALWSGILQTARRRVATAHPAAEFHVMLWDSDDRARVYARMVEALTTSRFRYHLATDILPDYGQAPERYSIPLDGHPNAKANALLAAYVKREILERSGQIRSP
jgi:hypothetical protein